MPNVLVSPHSASTSDRRNERLTNLFCANLRRFLNGEPLNNILTRRGCTDRAGRRAGLPCAGVNHIQA